MKLVIEFDYGLFWFIFTDYLFPVSRLEKSLHKQGKSQCYWEDRRWQVFAWLLFPVTILASFCDSIRIKRESGV